MCICMRIYIYIYIYIYVKVKRVSGLPTTGAVSVGFAKAEL